VRDQELHARRRPLPGVATGPLIEPTLRRTISAVRNADRPLPAAAKLIWNQLVGKS
jgi:hypothetical protein